MSQIHFLSEADAAELTKALTEEGYSARGRENPDPASQSRWLLEVQPFDDGVIAMVDVYGGWLPDEV